MAKSEKKLALAGEILFSILLFAVLLCAAGCGRQTQTGANSKLATNDIRYLSAHFVDPSHPAHVAMWNLKTNVVAVPTPPGMAAQVLTNVQKISSSQPQNFVANIVLPPPRIFTNSIDEYIPANGVNKTNRLWTALQYSSSLPARSWQTIASNEQISGSHVTNNVTSTNRSLYFRTVSQSN